MIVLSIAFVLIGITFCDNIAESSLSFIKNKENTFNYIRTTDNNIFDDKLDNGNIQYRFVVNKTSSFDSSIIKRQAVFTEMDKSNGLCLYSNIKTKINDCFENGNNNCK